MQRGVPSGEQQLQNLEQADGADQEGCNEHRLLWIGDDEKGGHAEKRHEPLDVRREMRDGTQPDRSVGEQEDREERTPGEQAEDFLGHLVSG